MAYKNPKKDRKYAHEAAIETPARKKKRGLRNKARYALQKEGKVHVGDGKDVDHKIPLSQGGSSARSNLRVQSAHDNRSYPRTASKKIAKKKSKKS